MDLREQLRKLKKEAECPLCLNTIREPKTLPCLHSLCLACLKKAGTCEERPRETAITCPVCSTSFPPVEGTYDHLPTSFHLSRLVDILAIQDSNLAGICIDCEGNNAACYYCSVCQIFMCKACFDSHQRLQVTRGHRRVLYQNLNAQDVAELIHRPVTCTQKYHGRKTLEYYCQKCKVCICHKCGLVDHSQHTMVEIKQASEQQKIQIMEVLEKVKRKVILCEKEITRHRGFFEESKETIATARNSVRTTVAELAQVLNEHQSAMMSELDDIYEAQERAYATQKRQCELFVSQLKRTVEYAEEILRRNIGPEILQEQQVVIKRCNDLLKTKTREVYKPLLMDYVTNEEALQNVKCILFGRVTFRNDYSSRSVVSGLLEAGASRPSFSFDIRDSGEATTSMRTPASSEELENFIAGSKDRRYANPVIPRGIGQHKQGAPMNWTPLTSSPVQYESVFSFGSPGKEQGKFDWPQCIAVNSRTGNVAVADRDNDRVQIFDAGGKFLTEFGRKGTGSERLCKPRSVAFAKSGGIIVVHSKKLSLFSEAGQFIEHIINPHLKQPWSVSVAPTGHVVVCDEGDKLIKLLSPDWTELQQSFNAPGGDMSLFTVYHQEKLFVSYHNADCVSVFNVGATLLYSIGREGSGDGQLSYPAGLAIDRFNNLVVCDYGNGRLQVFTPDGKFLNKMEGSVTHLGSPWSVAVSTDGRVFVTDLDKDCVHAFH